MKMITVKIVNFNFKVARFTNLLLAKKIDFELEKSEKRADYDFIEYYFKVYTDKETLQKLLEENFLSSSLKSITIIEIEENN
jgi:hypothetical protein